MRVGISKCAVMVFGSDGLGDDSTSECSLPDPAYTACLNIGGKLVPLATEYLYLGVTIMPSLAVKDLVAPLRQWAKDSHVPCPFSPLPGHPVVWPLVHHAVVLPWLLYGTEVYGMNRVLTNQM